MSFRGTDGIERVRPSEELFALSLLDERGNERILKSSDFAFTREENRFCYHRPDGLRVAIDIGVDADALRFRPRVSGWSASERLNWVDAPMVNVSTSGRLYWPFLDGYEITDYTTRTNALSSLRYRHSGWVGRCEAEGGYYPGLAQMQFLAHYQDGRGLYFATHDPKHTEKLVEWEYVDSKTIRLSLETLCGEAEDNVWQAPADIILRPYAGDWMEACGFYRDWVRTLPGFAAPRSRPDWMQDSPVTLIYPIKGQGMDNTLGMQPNRYYPYVNALSEVERYASLFESRVMALLMHWEGTAPWSPPYVWPPFGGENELLKFRDALHARGHLLGLYCSGTAWTQVSCVNPRYSREREFVDGELWRYMMRGPKGEIEATVCNHPRAQRFGYDMCLAEDWCRRTLLEELAKIAHFGVDYCQFFDQNLGGGSGRCWSARHHHPSVPGAWTTAAMHSLQAEMLAEIRKAGSRMELGCEGAAATPFVPFLSFNDARSFFRRQFGRSVPGVPYVFHEWMCNFSGNQVAVRTDEAFRWAYSFHAGDMLSVVLGPEGKLVTAWAVPWSEPLPDQKMLIDLVRSLNAIRRANPKYLFNGRMIRSPVKISVENVKVPREEYSARYPAVLSSYWQAADGTQRGWMTNWTDHEVEVTLEYPNGQRATRSIPPRVTEQF